MLLYFPVGLFSNCLFVTSVRNSKNPSMITVKMEIVVVFLSGLVYSLKRTLMLTVKMQRAVVIFFILRIIFQTTVNNYCNNANSSCHFCF